MTMYRFRNEHGHDVDLMVDRDDDHVTGIRMYVNGHKQIDTWLTNMETGALHRLLNEALS